MVTYIILGGFLEKIEYNRPQNPILILKAATLTPPPTHTPLCLLQLWPRCIKGVALGIELQGTTSRAVLFDCAQMTPLMWDSAHSKVPCSRVLPMLKPFLEIRNLQPNQILNPKPLNHQSPGKASTRKTKTPGPP